MIKLKQKRMLT